MLAVSTVITFWVSMNGKQGILIIEKQKTKTFYKTVKQFGILKELGIDLFELETKTNGLLSFEFIRYIHRYRDVAH